MRLSCQEPKSDLSNLRDCGFLCTGKLHILNTAGERPVWNLKPHCTEINCFYILIRAERLEHMKKDEKQREQKNKCVSRIMDNFSLKNENM